MARLPILTGQDLKILRTKTKKVAKVTKEIVKLLKDMEETVTGVGAGLAAPQIGSSHRVCVAMINRKFIPMINPEITWRSKETTLEVEGCLSIPGEEVPVFRANEVIVQFLDPKGKEQERKLKDWNARVIQHECDHLDGVLIVDYLNETLLKNLKETGRQ